MNFFENQIPYSYITPSPQSDEMRTGSRSSASDSRRMGMKKKSKDQGHLIVANEDGAQHTGSGDGMMGYAAGSRCGDTVGHGALPAQASGGG